MERKGALLACCFCSGLLAALAAAGALWLLVRWGIPAAAGVDIAPDFTPDWLYPHLIRGGLWGLAFYLLVPSVRRRRQWIRKGLWISLLPSLHQLFYVYPHQQNLGMMGMELGNLTPLFVLGLNGLWGALTGIFTRTLWGRG